MFKGKQGEDKLISWILVGAVIFLVYSMTATKVPVPPQAGVGGGEQVAADGTFKIVGAPCTLATTLTGSIVRRYTDVAQSSENITIYQNDVLKGTTAHGGTTTVQSGVNADKLDLFAAFDRSTTFYTRHIRGKLETCTGSTTSGSPFFKDVPVSEDLGDGVKLGTPVVYNDFPNKVLQIDTTASSSLFSIVNDGQANQNTGRDGTNLTIGSGGTASATITFRPGYNMALGPNGNVLACQFPQSVYDAVAPISVTYAGVSLEDTPTKPSTQNFALIGSNNTVKAFAFPGVDGRKTPTALIQIILRADSNHNPSGVLDRVNCSLFDSDYYTRQKDGKVVLDIENRDTNNNLGRGATGETVSTTPEASFELGVE